MPQDACTKLYKGNKSDLKNKTLLFHTLESMISGDLHTDPLTRYMLSTDGSINRVEPAAVVYPKHVDDVVTIVEFARKHAVSIHSRGAGRTVCRS